MYRYTREAVDVLAALAPTLAEAMDIARTKAFVILDGTPLPIDRIAADTPYYSGKHKRHGMNVQVLTAPFGRSLWASPALPGPTHDLTAARTHGIVDALTDADLKCWAEKAYQDAGPSAEPLLGHPLPALTGVACRRQVFLRRLGRAPSRTAGPVCMIPASSPRRRGLLWSCAGCPWHGPARTRRRLPGAALREPDLTREEWCALWVAGRGMPLP
ncbi:hypothetical protein GCM10010360_56770 [Streptomyces nogalater]